MDRQWIAVFATAMLSLCAFMDSSAAGRSRTSTLRRPVASASTILKSKNLKTAKPGLRGKPKCAPCTARLATKSKGRRAKSAKNLPCHPPGYVDPKIARNYRAAIRDMKRVGIKPKITSVWRSSDTQAQLHRCSLSTRCRRANPGLYGALPPGRSMHEAGFAVDMSGIAAGPRGAKRLTPRGRRIVGIMRKNGFNWRYGLADPAHFEADPRKHGYRSAKQAIKRTQTTCQINLAKNKTQKKAGSKIAVSASQSSRARLSPASTKVRRQANRVRA